MDEEFKPIYAFFDEFELTTATKGLKWKDQQKLFDLWHDAVNRLCFVHPFLEDVQKTRGHRWWRDKLTG